VIIFLFILCIAKTGEAVFTDDMPAMKGELHAAPILASAMPGTILEIDTSEAALKVF